MDLRTLIVGKLKLYREANNYSTYQLRKLERNKDLEDGQKKPIAKINVTTLNRIEKEPDFIPHKNTIMKLLKFFEIDFVETFEGVKIIEHEV